MLFQNCLVRTPEQRNVFFIDIIFILATKGAKRGIFIEKV